MNIHITIVKKISECKTVWNDFLPPVHHLQYRHLLAFEEAAVEDIENNYVQVFEKEKLIGLLYLQQFNFQHKHLNFIKERRSLSSLIKLILPKQLPLLVCGHLFRINYPGYYFKNPAHQVYVFDAIEFFIRSNNKYKPRGILIKDCNDVFIEQRCRLSGYHFFNGDVTMEITRKAHWLCFDDYLNDLKKDYHKRAKKILHALKPVQIKELDAAAIEERSVDIEKLYWNVVNKQTIKLGTINARYFYTLKKDLQENFELHAVYYQGTMKGFYTFIFYENEMETHYIGLDYEANKNFKLYFNILFLGIQKMIEKKYSKLELGRTAKEAKANTGALPRQIFNYINLRNPIIQMAVNYYLKKFNRSQSQLLLNRNPLK